MQVPIRIALAVGAVFATAPVVAGCGTATPREAPRSSVADAAGLEWSDATVRSVTDGDTLRLRDGRRVRLVQVDTPEVGDRAQCWGEQASDALRDRLPPGSDVQLAADPALDDADEHGRILRYVAQGDEVLNVWLVRQGHALPYFFRGERGAFADELLEAARDARSATRGMWGACRGVRLDPGVEL